MTTPPMPTLLYVAVEPRDASDRPALIRAMTGLLDEEPGCGAVIDAETGQMLIEGVSEAQLDAAIALLRGRHAIELNVGAPQIAYRETLARRVKTDSTHRTRAAGTGFEFARVKFVFAPGAISRFTSSLPENSLPDHLVAGVARGIETARRAGVIAGCPVVDVEATLVDGAWHEDDSTPAAFEKAAIAAFRHAQREVGMLLEPIMQVEVVGPDCHAGAMRDDLLLRRGEVGRVSPRSDGLVAIPAKVPLANLLGYPEHLLRLTGGRGRVTMTFSHFAPIEPSEPPSFPAASALRIA